MKLTPEEQNEPLMTTIGRLTTILKGYSKSSKERTIALFDKVAKESAENEIKALKYMTKEELIRRDHDCKDTIYGNDCEYCNNIRKMYKTN